MKRVILSVFLLTILWSCDDGEIVLENLDFENSTIDFCNGPSNSKDVVYAYKNDGTFESFSVEINNDILQTDEDGKIITPEEDLIRVNLNTQGQATYRIYSSEIPNDYFCDVVPPSNVNIQQEWVSSDGAIMFIQVDFADIEGNSDADGDGLSNIEENYRAQPLQDTDNDGIPDYLDIDDDNDNVLTRNELEAGTDDPIVVINGKEFLDTDEDGTPDYLDDDDDGDGIPTRNEVNPGETDPRNNADVDGLSNYRNEFNTEDDNPNETYPDHDINRDYRYTIQITNLELNKTDGSDESIRFDRDFTLGSFNETNRPFRQCPYEDCADEDTTDEEPTDGETTNTQG